MKLLVLALAAGALGSSVAQAQLALPGAVGTAPAEAPEAPGKAAAKKAHRTPSAKPIKLVTPSVDSIVGRALLLNGADGQLLLSSRDKDLQIDKFTLPGEVISDPKQKCRIDIVSETPIEAKSEGDPDGLERYAADIPACPLVFDVLDGAIQVPAQTTACVFQAADCQASPSGLWGPEGGSLERDAKPIAKLRSRADASIAQSLRLIEARDKASNAALTREQIDFASQRDELCRDYLGEARHGFCAARVTEARAALLHKRAEESARRGADSSN